MSRRSKRLKASVVQSVLEDEQECESQLENSTEFHDQNDNPSDESCQEILSEADDVEYSPNIVDEGVPKGRRKSVVWNYFTSIGNSKVQCFLCSAIMRYSGGTTANLFRHLRKKHCAEFPPPSNKQTELDSRIDSPKITITSVSSNGNETMYKRTNINSQGDNSDVDINQPWMFFNITTGNAKCKLCFQPLPYKSIDDFRALTNHLQAKHSVSFKQLVTDDEACTGTSNKPKSKFDTYFKDINGNTAVCKMCTYAVSYSSSNEKPLVSHLYWKHKNFFSKRYPSFWHFSKAFSKSPLSSESASKVDQDPLVSKFPTKVYRDCSVNNQDSSANDSVDRNQASSYSDHDYNIDDNMESYDHSHADSDDATDDIVQETDMTSSKTFSEHSHNILANFLKFSERDARCKFCSKMILFKGDLNVLEQHIYAKHRRNVIKKMLNVLMFSFDESNEERVDRENSNDKQHPAEALVSSQRNKQLRGAVEKIWSYFEKLDHLKFKCKICLRSFLLKSGDDTKELSEHVWYAHVQKIFNSVLTLQSFGKSEASLSILENYNCSNKKEMTATRRAKPNNSVKWTKPTGKTSKTWRYFLVSSTDSSYVKCRICHRILSFAQGAISNLLRHLRLKHPGKHCKNWSNIYRNSRMLCKNKKIKIIQKYSKTEINKSMSCMKCSQHFSDWKSLCKHIRIEHHVDVKNKIDTYEKKLKTNISAVQVIPYKKFTRYIKCKLCGEYILCSNEKVIENHLIEEHKSAYDTGLTHIEYSKNLKRVLTVDDHMNVSIQSAQKIVRKVSFRREDMCSYFLKSGTNYSKCKICRKFISKKIRCRHKVPLIFSVDFSVGTMSMRDSSVLKSHFEGNATTRRSSPMNTPRIYCCSISMMKSYCEICLKLRNTNEPGFICRCITNEKLVDTNDIMSISDKQVGESKSTQYLQDLMRPENSGFALMFSMNYFKKSCCLLCSDEIRGYKSYFLACFDHLISKHKSLLMNVHEISKNYFDQKMFDYQERLDTVLSSVEDSEKTSCQIEKISKELKSFCIKPPKRSRVWKLFTNVDANKVMCNACRKMLSFKSRGVGNLIRHLKRKHPSLAHLIKYGKNLETPEKSSTQVSENIASHESNVGKHSNVCEDDDDDDYDYTEISRDAEERPTQVSEKITRHESNVGKHSNICDTYTETSGNAEEKSTQVSEKITTHESNLGNDSNICDDDYRETSGNAEEKSTPEKIGKHKSNVWKHFKRCDDYWAECNRCNRFVSFRGGSTTNLSRHLKSKNCFGEKFHFTLRTQSSSKKKRSNVWSYFVKLPRGLAKCALCLRMFSHKGGNSSNLSRHLRTIHKIWIVTLPTHNEDMLSVENLDNVIAQPDSVGLTDDPTNNNNDIQTPGQSSEGMNTVTNFIEDHCSGEKVIVEGIYPLVSEEVIYEHGSQMQVVSDGILNSSENVTYVFSNSVEPNIQEISYPSSNTLENSPNVTVIEKDDSTRSLDLDALLKRDRKSWTWKHFSKLGDDQVECQICHAVLSFKSKGIQNLSRHLIQKHSLSSEKRKSVGETPHIVFMEDASQRKPPQRIRQPTRTSIVWNYFSSLNDTQAKCNICGAVLSVKYGPSSNLYRHLELKHNFQKKHRAMEKV